MDSQPTRLPRGSHPDVVVKGRPLHEWTVEEVGETTEEMFAWKQAVVKATGALFDEAVGPATAARFQTRFKRLAQEEEKSGRIGEFMEGAIALGHDEARVTDFFYIHAAEGPTRKFAAIRVGGGKKVIGTENGQWREFDFAELMSAAGI
jgi:hypothetical protein